MTDMKQEKYPSKSYSKEQEGIQMLIEELVLFKHKIRLYVSSETKSITGFVTKYDARRGWITMDNGLVFPEKWVLKIELIDEDQDA